MIKSYLKIALRNLHKHRSYTALNVVGLGLGVFCCLLILLFVQDERSYDRFHENADRIYRVTVHQTYGGQTNDHLLAPVGMGATLAAALPAVEQATKVRSYASTLVTRGDQPFYEDGVFAADPTFFDVFSFSLLQGNPETALANPRSVVLCEHLTRKYFGEENPVGQSLRLNTTDYEVTGVAAEVPHNAHFHFHLLLSFNPESVFGSVDSWAGGAYPTYLLLAEGYTAADVEAALPPLKAKYLNEEQAARIGYGFQPLTAIHLYSNLEGSELEPTGDIRYVYLFATIALLVLLIACVNYMNLATARSARRAREVGVRKALGANRSHLRRQFLGESLVMSSLAVALGIALVELALPTFNRLVQKEIAVQYLGPDSILPVLLGIVLLVGLIAGSYPAFFLSAFNPARVLKSATAGSRRGYWLRSGLVTFQFAVSIMLIVATVVVQHQLNYVQTKRLGFDKEHVVVIRTRGAVKDTRAAFTEALAGLSSVKNVAENTPTGMHLRGPAYPEGWDEDGEGVMTWLTYIDYDFLPTLGIEIAEGRAPSADHATDARDAVLVNEAAVREYGWDDPVGKTIRLNDEQHRVIGVVKDYHYRSLKEAIAPLVLMIGADQLAYSDIAARVYPTDLPATLAALEATWKTFAPDRPFEYRFLDEEFGKYYQAEQRLGRIFGAFSFLAILISCLGLFGLASFTTEQRTKEIGIRKVLGASASGLVVMLSKDFTRLIGLAFLVSAPLAYFAMNQWLEDFAYRIDISWPIFLTAGLAALGVALLTVSYQAIKAALADPVKSLRYE